MTNNIKKPYLIDVPVLLIFFNRPKCLKQVFEVVKEARPSTLFLYQDGVREGNKSDLEGVEGCREIVEDIDWDCTVYKLFQTKNYGCDPSEFIAQKWAFNHVDKCIILEDDDVPAQSFFPFCKILLDKYEHDTRINMICGMNNLEKWDTPYSYLFTEAGSIWGWATWKRVADEWDDNYGLFNNDYCVDLLDKELNIKELDGKNKLKYWKKHADTHVAYYESILSIGQLTSHRLNIVPSYNMITNIGNLYEGGTHSVAGLEMIPAGLRRLFTMKRYEIAFPLKDPPYVIPDNSYTQKLYRLMGVNHPFVRFYRQVEKVILILRHRGIKEIVRKYKGKKL